jgi:hypothetical protein
MTHKPTPLSQSSPSWECTINIGLHFRKNIAVRTGLQTQFIRNRPLPQVDLSTLRAFSENVPEDSNREFSDLKQGNCRLEQGRPFKQRAPPPATVALGPVFREDSGIKLNQTPS